MIRLALAAVAALMIAALLGQHAMIKGLSADVATRDQQLEQAHAANSALEGTIRSMAASRAADGQLVARSAERVDRLSKQAKSLERKLTEALNHVEIRTLDTVLPAAATDALCLRWRSASGQYALPDQGNATRSAPARAGDSDAVLSADPCAGWRGISLRDVVEWTGLLLDHAGEQRLDKAALREWAQR